MIPKLYFQQEPNKNRGYYHEVHNSPSCNIVLHGSGFDCCRRLLFVESLAINADGSVLFGVTMDSGSIVPETLFAIDKSNASTTPLCSLEHGHTTKAIAFNTDDGMIYHGSGIDLQLFEKLNVQTCQTTPIGFETDQLIGPMALVYVGSNNFLLADGRLYDVTSNGVVSNIRSMDHASKGLAAVQGPLPLSNLSISGNCRRTRKTTLLENVTVRNNTGVTAFKALLGTRIPTGLQFVSDSSGRCSVTQDLLTCPLNDLGPMASISFQIRYKISLPQNAIIRHDLRISSNEFELIQNATDNTLAINSSCK